MSFLMVPGDASVDAAAEGTGPRAVASAPVSMAMLFGFPAEDALSCMLCIAGGGWLMIVKPTP